MDNRLGKQSGQTLIEILIALAIIVLVLVAIVSRTVEAVANANFARNQVMSTRLAQEGVEWTRAQRDRLGWHEFAAALDADPVTYCLIDLDYNIEALSPGGACMIPGTLFSREVTIDYIDDPDPDVGDYASVEVTVSWTDGSGDHQSFLRTRLSEWLY